VVDSANADFTYISSCKVSFFSDTTCTGGIISHSWDFGDITSGSNTSTLADPIHTFTLDGHAYLVTHTVTTANGTSTTTQSVIQVGGPVASITGYQVNNCGNGTITYTAPCVAGITYSWAVTGGTGTVTLNGCQNDINWSAAGGQVILTAWDSINDCTTYATLDVAACCINVEPNTIVFNNTSAKAVLLDPAFAPYISGTSVTNLNVILINGVFTIDTTFTFLNCPYISFGTNALTYINPSETLTYCKLPLFQTG
jgi:PKD repeat protein